jgi:transposase
MKKSPKYKYVKRTQKDYSMSFKMSVVDEIEREGITYTAAAKKYGIQARSTVRTWVEKYGTFEREYQTHAPMPKSQEQKIMELEQKVKLLEKQKAKLEREVENSDKKAVIFDMMISLAEKEYNIPIRKKCLPEQSTSTEKKPKRR